MGALWSGGSELAALTDSDFDLGRQLGLDSVAFGYLQTAFGVLQLLGGPVFGRYGGGGAGKFGGPQPTMTRGASQRPQAGSYQLSIPKPGPTQGTAAPAAWRGPRSTDLQSPTGWGAPLHPSTSTDPGGSQREDCSGKTGGCKCPA